MVAKVYSATLIGLEGQIVQVEVDVYRGKRRFEIVGLGDKAVQEAKERVTSAIKNNGFTFPMRHITVNLAPADVPKSGPLFDLPIAIGILISTGQIKLEIEGRIFIGELSLEGELQRVPGILAITDSIRRAGFKEIILPKDNLAEALMIKGVKAYGINKIIDLGEEENWSVSGEKVDKKSTFSREKVFDLVDVKGQTEAKRVLEIAAAGGHNLLLSGSPGSGKSMLAKRISGILPEMTLEEKLETTKIYSASNILPKGISLVDTRPFRSPHHTISQIALVGGGSYPKPGEISLANRGVLFLDEFTEFSNQSLEVLRQPLEDKIVTISRASGSITYPANFMLVAAMNPCKCGWLGDPDKECICMPRDIEKYSRKISGPVLDRIDLQLKVSKVNFTDLTSNSKGEGSESVRKRVQLARNIQLDRLEKSKKKYNSEMEQGDIEKFIRVGDSGYRLLERAVNSLNLSARGYFKVLKVARTIADLGGRGSVKREHVAEALGYRLAT